MQCDFEKLVHYLDKSLELDDQLEVLTHVDECESCFDTVFHLSRERDARFFVYRPYREKVSAR
jgi:hypothetical protein